MFKTSEHSAMFEKPVGQDGIQFWSLVEHEIYWPWFYLQVVQEDRETLFRTMLMLSSTAELAAIVSARTDAVWLEKAYLTSPSDLNGTTDWVMEPLERVEVLRDRSGIITSATFTVTGGRIHSIGELAASEEYASQICFSADAHLGRLSIIS